MSLPLDEPALLAELTALHERYELALVANDTATLAHLFWDSPHTIRYGVREHLYGAEAIAAYRESTPLAATSRKILRRTLHVFGDHTASIMCEIEQTVAGQPQLSRQTQLWIKFPELGWKITAAHVSIAPPDPAEFWKTYAKTAARALDLPLAPEHLAGTAQNLARTAALAAPLLAHALPESTERAAIFTP